MGVEQETRDFLILVLKTISAVVMWMMIHVFTGIYLEYAFFESTPSWKNLIYYIFVIATFIYLLKYIRKKWKI